MTRLLGKTVYADSNVFIYTVEGIEPYAQALRPLLASVAAGETRVVTSELTVAEVLVKPLRLADAVLYQAFEDALAAPGVRLVPISYEVLLRTARLRAAGRLRTPDAVHAATAQLSGCDVLLTNDAGIVAVPGVEVVRLSEIAHG